MKHFLHPSKINKEISKNACYNGVLSELCLVFFFISREIVHILRTRRYEKKDIDMKITKLATLSTSVLLCMGRKKWVMSKRKERKITRGYSKFIS